MKITTEKNFTSHRDDQIEEAEAMCFKKYGVRAEITFNAHGFDLGISNPVYYREHAREALKMVEDIIEIIGPFCNTRLYIL